MSDWHDLVNNVLGSCVWSVLCAAGTAIWRRRSRIWRIATGKANWRP